jgi:hypothetical protein
MRFNNLLVAFALATIALLSACDPLFPNLGPWQ